MSLTPYVHLALGSLREVAGGAMVPLPDEARTHLERVLRLKAGAKLVVADGEGREAAALLGVGNVVIDGPVVSHDAPAVELHLVQGLAKGRKTDDIVRSATELGVDRVTIVASQRSVTKPVDNKRERMADRWRSVARGAAEQSRRARLPVIEGPVKLDELLASWPEGTIGVIGHPAASNPLRAGLGRLDEVGITSFVAAVGPEGGWDDRELDALEGVSLVPVTLGQTVLRTEHAGHALCAVVAFHLGRMD